MKALERLFAEKLLKVKAVKIQPANPFTWASGWKSPIYCDNRKTLSYPALRNFVKLEICRVILEKFGEVDAIAGVATGAIAHGVLAADRMQKPFVYVRPKPKDHGTGSQIEGELAPGKKVVVIEDLISTGMSSLAAVKALRDAGAQVLGMVAIFTYGFDLAAQRFAEDKVRLDTLSNYSALVDVASETGYISSAAKTLLHEWRENPSEWGK